MIAIIDYGMGNLRSVQKGFERVGASATVTRDAAEIERADGVVLPGVGAFGACMDNLRSYGLSIRSARSSRAASRFSGSASGCSCCSRRARSSGR